MLDHADPVLVADLFPIERTGLLKVLGGLSADEWGGATVCPGWCVRDIALHLLAGDLGKLGRCRDGYEASTETLPPPPLPEDFPSLVVILNALNDRRVHELRWLSTGVILDLLTCTGGLVHAYLAGLDPFAPGEQVSWAGPGPAPNWLDTAREFTERWVHQQQIREATGRPPSDDPRMLRPVLATFARALPRAMHEAAADIGTTARLRVTGPAGGDWYVVRARDAWALHDRSDAVPRVPVATVTLDQDIAWRRYTKNVDAVEAEQRARLEGDVTMARRLLGAVAIIG